MDLKILGKIIAVLGVIFFVFCIFWVSYLNWAHSTFENYYSFRGCTELIEKTDNYGICKLQNGQSIKLVLYQGKWFLDGDLPDGSFLDW